MCGIFFSSGFENLSPQVIDAVTHRGPDGRGWNEFSSKQGPVVLAHRRLSILDLSEEGRQPMASEDGRYWITYNGEVYNYLEIRAELEAKGHRFHSMSDTEVLLKAYIEWGTGCLNRLNGMFAFVIWDDREKRFFAARDRFGIKPLYVYRQGEKFALASEIKQFKFLDGWQTELNQEMASFYLAKGYADHDQETLYKQVTQVLPGEYLDNQLTPQKWYSLKERVEPKNLDDKEAVEQFSALFEDAVKLRLRSDVTVGSCLSGGVDSTSIISMVRKIAPDQDLHTFSSVFPGKAVDESTYIDLLIEAKQLKGHKNYPDPEDMLGQLDKVLYHQDLPFLGTSIFAQWKTFESAKQHEVTVLLDGQGADESLMGYPWMLYGLVFSYLYQGQLPSLFSFIEWQRKMNNQPLLKIMILALQHRHPKLYNSLLRLKGNHIPEEQKMTTMMDMCLHQFATNLQSLLRYEDRNSMAFSRESRLPFLDYRLVEFIFSLPTAQKFRHNETKWVLRESMKGLNLDEILNRKDKIGFATPESEWLSLLQGKESSFKDFIFKRWLSLEGIK